MSACWDPKCRSHEDNYVGSAVAPPEGEFIQRHDGNSNIHIVRTVEDAWGMKKVTTACGGGWYVSALRHANGDAPRQCAKCWEAM